MNEGKYNIKAVSKLTGVQPGTLRAWERRYHILQPVRNEAGHRLYTEEHVKILKWLVSKVNQGFSISQAVSLMVKHDLQSDELMVEKDAQPVFDSLLEELLMAFVYFDERKAQDMINKAFSMFTIDKVTRDIFLPLLSRIGEMREAGEMTTAHEHFATAIIRSRLGMIMHSYPHNGILPKVVAVCGPNERHELDLMIFTLFMRRRGYDVIYIGPGIKEDDLIGMLKTVQPRFLFLSCTLKENLPDILALADQLSTEFEEIEIGIGGAAVDRMSKGEREKYQGMVVGHHQEWEKWLKAKM
ncbi:MAG TPA: MerR family transcriptional regulator [Chondromyces sp.]|nr:MerR family transcriptional regulator [Chondromyces sp.]